MNRTQASLVALISISHLAAGLPALADIRIPSQPPTAAQLQAPPPAQAAAPVALAVKPAPAKETKDRKEAATAPADLVTFVKDSLNDLVRKAPGTVLLEMPPANPAPVEETPLAAKNLAADPVPAHFTIDVAIPATLTDPPLGTPHLPVTLTIRQGEKTLGNQTFRVVPKDRAKAKEEFRAFLGRHLPLEAGAAPGDGPRLRLWMENSDGATVKLGSQVALYWQATANGYVSLYHFGAGGTIQRIFPSPDLPGNFVEAGRIYRFPAQGHLTFTGKTGPESFRAVITSYPSNISRQQPDGLSFKGEPLRIIPTHYPMLFANEDLSRVFALPATLFSETSLNYTLAP